VSVEFAPLLIEPAYRKVAAAIGARVLSRALREGERLPSETELARQFGVNRSTVREALRELESRGLVQRRPGSKLMSVSRPHHETVAEGVSHALLLHDVTVRDVWEALTILEPPIARAAAIPARSPVKDPGPTVTATRPSDAKPPVTRAITRSINGKSASAWPRSIAIVSIACGLSAPSSRTQAEIAGSAVSIANIFMCQCSKLVPTSIERGERTGRSPGN